MIDAHVHLWLRQNGLVNGLPVYDLGGGRSMFGGEIRQMLPPAMTDGVNGSTRTASASVPCMKKRACRRPTASTASRSAVAVWPTRI